MTSTAYGDFVDLTWYSTPPSTGPTIIPTPLNNSRIPCKTMKTEYRIPYSNGREPHTKSGIAICHYIINSLINSSIN